MTAAEHPLWHSRPKSTNLTGRLAVKLLLGDKIEDTPELEALRELVVSELQSWAVAGLDVVRVSEKYMPA